MAPTLEYEAVELDYGPVVGIDEVGRGALAGPVMVGAVVLDALRPMPAGLNDSKLLSPKKREGLVPLIEAWASSVAVGEASAQEIDAWGLRTALAVAADRALSGLCVVPQRALIDGSLNILRPPETMYFGSRPPEVRWRELPVLTLVKGDQRAATISAAAVIAKVRRDAFMRELERSAPQFAWSENKGYGSLGHRQALATYGPTPWHRRSWSLPELGAVI